MADIKAIAEELVNLTVKEVNELATVLKDEYGIEPAAAAVAVAAGPCWWRRSCCRREDRIRRSSYRSWLLQSFRSLRPLKRLVVLV